MNTKKEKNIQAESGFGIIALIAFIVALSGIAGIIYYVQNNQSDIETIVEESREGRAQEAQENGYPAIWAEDDLPEYPNGELKKVREMGNVTLETSDSPAVVGAFFATEMTNKGFNTAMTNSNDLVSFAIYKQGSKALTVQATVQKKNGLTKVVLLYHR